MSAERRQMVSRAAGKIAFDCPGCGIRLMMDPAYPAVSGSCPSCGGWIRAPRLMQAMPVSHAEVCVVSPVAKVPFRAKPMHQTPSAVAGIAGVSPEAAGDPAYEAKKEMKGFYRFLATVLVVVFAGLAVIGWVVHVH